MDLPNRMTLDQWIVEARRDDVLEHMVPSDLRQIFGEIDRLRKLLVETRKSVVVAISFLGRDHGTERADRTVPQIIRQLAEADREIIDALKIR
jgi:hypothetical protein